MDEGVDTLFSDLYPELRRIAHARLRANPRSGLLDTTALVHESYEKLAARSAAASRFVDRNHFMAYASRTMRSVVVDLAREQLADKRGGDLAFVTLTTALGSALAHDEPEVLRVHEALEELAQIDARLAQIVEMRYFGGLEHGEIAAALGVSLRTVERGWEKARSYLFASLNGG
jgi:RNA polymerase sigma factor (TIGR02999 family)